MESQNDEINSSSKSTGSAGATYSIGDYHLLVAIGPDVKAAGQVAEKLKVSPATLSFDFKTLSYAELVESRKGRPLYLLRGKFRKNEWHSGIPYRKLLWREHKCLRCAK